MTTPEHHVCSSCGANNLEMQLYCQHCWNPVGISSDDLCHNQRTKLWNEKNVNGPHTSKPPNPRFPCGHDNSVSDLYCQVCWTPSITTTEKRKDDKFASAIQRHSTEFVLSGFANRPSNYRRFFVIVIVLIALTLAISVRLYTLETIPYNFQFAEKITGPSTQVSSSQAWKLPTSTASNPPGLIYLTSIWLTLAGDSLTGVRSLAALISTVSIAVFFVFCRSLTGNRAAIFATLFMVFNLWNLGHSWILVPATLVPFFTSLSLYLLYLGLQGQKNSRRNNYCLIGAGALVGSGFYFHNAATILLVITLVLWTREFIALNRPIQHTLQASITFFVPAVLVLLTFMILISSHSFGFSEPRSDLYNLDGHDYQSFLETPGKPRYLVHQLGYGFQTLVWQPQSSDSATFNLPRINDPLTAILAISGLFISLIGCQNRRHFFLLTIFGACVATVGFTATEDIYRHWGIVPLATLALAGISLERALSWTKGRLPNYSRLVLAGAIMSIIVSSNLALYNQDPAAYAGNKEIRLDQ